MIVHSARHSAIDLLLVNCPGKCSSAWYAVTGITPVLGLMFGKTPTGAEHGCEITGTHLEPYNIPMSVCVCCTYSLLCVCVCVCDCVSVWGVFMFGVNQDTFHSQCVFYTAVTLCVCVFMCLCTLHPHQTANE